MVTVAGRNSGRFDGGGPVGEHETRFPYGPRTFGKFAGSLSTFRRRHARQQRAMVAARLANLEHGSNRYAGKVGGQICPPTFGVSTTDAADMLGNCQILTVHTSPTMDEAPDVFLTWVAARGRSVPAGTAARVTSAESSARRTTSEPAPPTYTHRVTDGSGSDADGVTANADRLGACGVPRMASPAGVVYPTARVGIEPMSLLIVCPSEPRTGRSHGRRFELPSAVRPGPAPAPLAGTPRRTAPRPRLRPVLRDCHGPCS